jgi:hypothetical protein
MDAKQTMDGQTRGNQDRSDERAESRKWRRPRPVLWNGTGLEWDCADFVPVIWDGSCLD